MHIKSPCMTPIEDPRMILIIKGVGQSHDTWLR
jgi:hypothetical protein